MNKMLCRPLHRGISRRDTLAIQRLFSDGALGGYWPADPAYAYEDSAGTIPASVNGVVGSRTNAVATLPNAIQSTTANKPYLRKTPTSGKYWFDSNTSTGALTATFSGSLGSACTIASVTPEGVSILDNQTVGSTYNICPPFGYNGDVLIINRALTAAEKALVTRVMQRNVPMLGSELVTNGGFEVVSDGIAGYDNGNGTVVGYIAQRSYLSVVGGKLNIRSNTSEPYSAGFYTSQQLTGQLFVKAKMDRIIGTHSNLFLLLQDNPPYDQYINISYSTSPVTVNYATVIPLSTAIRLAFYATSEDYVDQTITVDDISLKAIL